MGPDKVVKLTFPSGRVPRGVETSIYAAAGRKRMRVSAFVRGAVLYISDNPCPESKHNRPVLLPIRCEVCGGVIDPKPGTSEQYVCAGTKRKKSECQKVRRYAREHGISIEQAKQRRHATYEAMRQG